MNISLLCQNSYTGIIYDATTLVKEIQYTTDLSGQPGKLTFTLEEDPNAILELSSGSFVQFTVSGQGIFMGRIFSRSTDESGAFKITAYDQMRYLKNEESMVTEDMTASQIFEKICANASIPGRVLTSARHILPPVYHNKKSLYGILEESIQNTNIAERKQYFIRDDFGTLVFTELGQNRTNLVITERSMLMNYQYEASIDKETFNIVKIVRDNEDTMKRETWIEFDSGNQVRWGKLQRLEKAEKEQNEAQIRELAANILKARNRESKTLKISVLGSAAENAYLLTAGFGFILQIQKLGISQDVWITAATHTFEKDYHTLALEVFI